MAIQTVSNVLALARSAAQEPRAWNLLLDACAHHPEKQKAIIREVAYHASAQTTRAYGEVADWANIYWRAMCMVAPYDLDAFLIYIERYRPAKEKFYLPRRRVLYRVVCAIQKLADDELDELILNMPARVGKTTLLLFCLLWMMGRDPESTSLYCAYSDKITKAFYKGALEILQDSTTYAFHEIFPNATIAQTSGDDYTIDLVRAKHYPTLTARSLYGTLNGSCDCNGFLIADDLLAGIEDALSPVKLEGAQYRVDNNMLMRAKQQAKILWCGTPWSVNDPMGRRKSMLEEDPAYAQWRWEHIALPALDENDESNFDYDHNVGFSTAHYHRMRARFKRNDDMASWETQCQCNPVERHGALFNPEQMLYYNGELPSTPERTVMPVDPAWGGGDYVSAPVIQVVNGIGYVPALVYSKEDKVITQPMVATLAKEYKVQFMEVEATKMTREYAEGIKTHMADRTTPCSITTRPAPNNTAKEFRIQAAAPEIRELRFLEPALRNDMYDQAMTALFTYNPTGKNKNDDFPDSLAQGIGMLTGSHIGSVEVGSRRALGY